ncbi:hypothetical protein GCM10027517_36430 [Phycicoccus ginsengisoli]
MPRAGRAAKSAHDRTAPRSANQPTMAWARPDLMRLTTPASVEGVPVCPDPDTAGRVSRS